jgi:diguanylate cyclase (GGDEF)-like protein
MVLAVGLATSGGLFPGLHPDALAHERNIRFDRVSLEQGLSQSAINFIMQDSQGFMWFGTEDGLNRYDGYEFTVYKRDSEDPASLSHNFVWTILEDSHGAIWVGTDGGGLNRFNRDDGSFTRFTHDEDAPSSLAHDHVRVVFEDREGVLWVGTDGGGLDRFDPENESFVHAIHDDADPTSIGHDRIRAIYEDGDGVLWIGTYEGGIDRFDRKTGEFTHYRHDPHDLASLSDDRVYTIHGGKNGALWIGTYGRGLNRFDPRTGSFVRYRHDAQDPHGLAADRVRAIYLDDDGTLWVGTDGGLNEWLPGENGFNHYRHDPADPRSPSDNKITALYRDRGGVLWVGTKSGGLNKWNTGTAYFRHVKQNPGNAFSLTSNMVSAIQQEAGGVVWVGTFGGGLNRVDRSAGMIAHVRHDPNDPTGLADDHVMSLLIDHLGVLWVGTYENGLDRLARGTGNFQHFRHDPDDPGSLTHNGVMAMHEDRQGTLWVGTYGGGLNRFDRVTKSFAHFKHDPADPTSLSSARVSCFAEDASGALWVGTDGGGLNRLDRSTGTFTHYGNDPEDPNGLGSDVIWSIHVDRDDVMWIGSQGGGLTRWDPADRKEGRAVFQHYTERDGLPNDFVYGVLSDDEGCLWLSTNKGLARFDPRNESFRSYDTTHGLQSNEFNFGAYHRGVEGELFFGGINGYNVFRPGEVRDNPHVPPVVLTSFLKFNRKAELDQPLAKIEKIVLGYKDDVVSFEFAALDFTSSEKNRYAYKLDGFDEDWNELGGMRRATYTNLPAGEYLFRVKASNNDGVWNEEGATLPITVRPPPWQTWWAYTLYAMMVVGALLAYTRSQQKKLQREAEYSRKLEREVEARTQELAQRNHELQLANGMLEEASLTDSLTGLKNRRYLMTEIDKDIALTERYYVSLEREGKPRSPLQPDFLFLMIDLDGLKGINDTYGHMAGDMALLQMRDILKQVCRKSDTIIRWGGDEFLIVGRSLDLHSAERLAERIRDAVDEHPFELGIGEPMSLSCSVGFAQYPFLPGAPTLIGWEQVVTIADRALYMAKRSGRNAWVAIFGNERTPADDLVQQINDQTKELVEQGVLEFRTSIPSTQQLVWERN